MAKKLEGISHTLWKPSEQFEYAESLMYAGCMRDIARDGTSKDFLRFYEWLITPEHVDELSLRTIYSIRSLLPLLDEDKN